MKKILMVSLTVAAFAGPALAAGATYYVEQDTVGNCSVVDSKPSTDAGMTILGNQDGYASKDAAKAFLKGLPQDKCKGIVG
jgi:outer membrane protein W